MCNVYAQAAVAVVQTGVSIYGQQQQAQAEIDALKLNAKVNETNARNAEQNIIFERQAQAREEMRQRIKTASMVGQQRAGFGASGIDIGSGTALNVQTSTAGMGFEDLLSIRETSISKQRNLHQQAIDFTTQANLLRSQARNVRRAANLQGFTTVVGNAVSFATKGVEKGWFKGGGTGDALDITPSALDSGGGAETGGTFLDMESADLGSADMGSIY
jgi:hypothetical protein